jgi:hypothetical protein
MDLGTESVFHLFWEDSIWLPPNTTWKDVEPTKDGVYTEFTDLWYPIPVAFAILLLRYVFERYIFKPLGLAFGIKDSKHAKPSTNSVLENQFNLSKRTKSYQIDIPKLAVELNMRERQIEYWLKRRRLYGKPTTMQKFCETGWRWFYYSSVFIYGVICLWDKPWLWNIRYCWYNYPHHDVPKEVWWYYMVELSFYWSLSFSQFFDVKRKDFVEMFIHHVTTIALLCFSWTCNLFRCGTLVLIIHDFADIFLESAKLCHYAKLNTVCDIIFAIFAVCWIITRLGIFPIWILYSTTVEAPQMLEMFPAYYIFNVLLTILLVLHVIWTYFILKIAYNAVYANKEKGVSDSRSDSSGETCSTTDDEARKKDEMKKKQNGLGLVDQNGVVKTK